VRGALVVLSNAALLAHSVLHLFFTGSIGTRSLCDWHVHYR